MILELDLGNTRAKWRIIQAQNQIVTHGVAETAEWLEGHFPSVWQGEINRIRVASVLSETTERVLAKKIESHLTVPFELARSISSCNGVVNSYAEPGRLGVDRWLALIAAYQACRAAIMVIDAGTALKVDAVDATGYHRGGYIIPGPMLMEDSLLRGTDRVRFEKHESFATIDFGKDTRACVQNGIAAALVGAVLIAYDQIKKQLDVQPRLYITGGLGELLKRHLQNFNVGEIFFERDLVLNGLCWALP